jgi:outer membrane protein assembly factor BamB
MKDAASSEQSRNRSHDMNIRRDAFSALMLLVLLATPVFAQEDDGSPTPGTLKWSFQTGGQVVSSPAISADGATVYVGSNDRRVYAIDAETGATNWVRKLTAPINASPVLDPDGTIYIGCTDGRLYAIIDDGTNSRPKWPRPFAAGTAVTTVAIDDDGSIYVGSRGNHLFALDPADGGRKWIFTAPEDASTPAISASGDIFFKAGRRLIGLNSSGAETFSFLADRAIGSLPAFGENGANGIIYFGSLDNRVYAVRTSGSGTNATRWRFDTGDDVRGAPAVGAGGEIYIGTDARRVYCLTTNGVVRWRFNTKGPVRSPLAIGADGTVYAGAEDRRLYAITADGSNKWTFTGARGAIRSSPAIDAEGTVYFGSLDRRVYAVYDNVPSATNAWPQFRHDAAHTARTTSGEPFITQQPPSQVGATNGQRIELTVRVRSGTAVTYRWLFNGDEIDPAQNATATNATLVIASVSATNQGKYEVMVMNDFDEITSDPTTLFIRGLVPVITSDLTNRTVNAGSTVKFEVQAVGEPPLRFQWFFNGAAIPGQTTNSFTITNAQAANAGSFHVSVSNTNGSTLSHTSVLTVLTTTTLAITQQPTSRNASITSTVGFSATATGASPITYQWRFNSNSIPVSQNSSATNSALVLQNIQATNQGSYDVVVANSFGSVTSAVATLTITNVPTNSGPPSIVVQPADKTSFASSSAEFKVVASGAPPLSYQWRFKGIEISSASNLTAITDTLTLVNLRTNDAGGYDVIVTNFLGAVTSAVATLTVAQIVPPLAACPRVQKERPCSPPFGLLRSRIWAITWCFRLKRRRTRHSWSNSRTRSRRRIGSRSQRASGMELPQVSSIVRRMELRASTECARRDEREITLTLHRARGASSRARSKPTASAALLAPVVSPRTGFAPRKETARRRRTSFWTTACAATASWHPPPIPRRNARSASTHW